MSRICAFFRISVVELFGIENRHTLKGNVEDSVLRFAEGYAVQNKTSDEALLIKRFRACDDYGKQTISYIAERESERSASSGKPVRETVSLRVYCEPASAGYGNYIADGDYDTMSFDKSAVPPNTDFCVKLTGDSMAPDYPDGCLVFIESLDAIDDGQIGIFIVSDGAYCKKLVVDHGRRQTRLTSLNNKYEDIVVTEGEQFRTIGRVLGVAQQTR